MANQLDPRKIRIDGGTQMRQSIDYATVDEYETAYRREEKLPPLKVFYDGAEYWLADGFHRWHASQKAKLAAVPCDVEQGSVRDAIMYACGANQTNGLRRTNADKRVAVMKLLHDPEWSKKSDRWIAEKCGVSDPFVGEMRKQVQAVSSSTNDEKRTGRDGKSRKQPKRKHSKPVNLHVPPIDEPTNNQPAASRAAAKLVQPDFADEREWVRTLHDLANAMRRKQTKLDIDKAVIVHNLTTAANDIAEAIQSAEEAA